MKRNYKRYRYEPQPSVSDPRRYLLAAVLAFVREAKSLPGVLRIALVGSLATDKPVPKDADVLVSIDASMDLSPLARIGRRLQGTAQQINLGGDVFWQTNRADISGASATIGNATPARAARRNTAAFGSISTTIFKLLRSRPRLSPPHRSICG